MAKKALNVVVLGATGVGKTAIISHLLRGKFPDHESLTIELEEETYTIGKKGARINVIDTPGGYCFNDRRRIAISSGDAFILVFSLDDDCSFITAAMLKDDIVRFKPRNTPVLLVGNKADLDADTHITTARGASLFAELEWCTKYIETSALEGYNVEKIFREIVKLHGRRKWFSKWLKCCRFSLRYSCASTTSTASTASMDPHDFSF